MALYKETLPSLEINTKKSSNNSPKLLRIYRNHFITSISKIKAYSFFNKIEEKHKNNNQKNSNNFLKLSIDNYKAKKNNFSEYDEIVKKMNSIKVKQMLDEIRRKEPSFVKYNKNLGTDIGDDKSGKSPKDKFRKIIFKNNIRKELAKKEKALYNLRNDSGTNLIKFFRQNQKFITSRKKIMIPKEKKILVYPLINDMSLYFDTSIKSNSFNSTKNSIKNFNENRLEVIKKNIININDEINNKYPKINKRHMLTRINKSYKAQNNPQLYNDNLLFKRYFNFNKK